MIGGISYYHGTARSVNQLRHKWNIHTQVPSGSVCRIQSQTTVEIFCMAKLSFLLTWDSILHASIVSPCNFFSTLHITPTCCCCLADSSKRSVSNIFSRQQCVWLPLVCGLHQSCLLGRSGIKWFRACKNYFLPSVARGFSATESTSSVLTFVVKPCSSGPVCCGRLN